MVESIKKHKAQLRLEEELKKELEREDMIDDIKFSDSSQISEQ